MYVLIQDMRIISDTTHSSHIEYHDCLFKIAKWKLSIPMSENVDLVHMTLLKSTRY